MNNNQQGYITQPELNSTNNESIQKLQPYLKQLNAGDLETISMKNLKEKKRQTEKQIQITQARINYMKMKQQNATKKMYHVKKRLSYFQRAKSMSKQHQELKDEYLKKQEIQRKKKSQFTKLLRDHLECNKKIVFNILNQKVKSEAQKMRTSKQIFDRESAQLRDGRIEQNFERANRVRHGHLILNEKKRIFFLEKLKDFKNMKQERLKFEIKIKQSHQMRIYQLEQKQQMLMQRLSASQNFKIKCEEQYFKAKGRYASFYEQAVTASKGSRSLGKQTPKMEERQQKAAIFIS